MAQNVTSPDISVLDFCPLLDFSIAVPSFSVTNNSTVVTAANLQWVFELRSPNGTPIHIGSFDAPDIDGVPFTTYNFTEQIPQIFGQIEFSKINGYDLKVLVKDSNGTIHTLSKNAAVCKPNGNQGKNNFGAADIDVKALCGKGKLYVTDNTNLIYKGITGTKITTQVNVTYPKDPTGNTLAQFSNQILPALVPIKIEGDGYNIYVAHVYEYDLGDCFKVRVRFSFTKTFPVWCNVDLCPLFCEIDKIVLAIDRNCDPEEKAEQNNKLLQINSKLLKAVTGIMQPLCGWDVPAIIEEIKEIGGFTCDCCRPRGISNVGAATNGDISLSVNKVCGDMTMTFDNDGSGNFVLNYQNFSYVFALCNEAGNSTAFEFKQSTSGCVKTTCLKVDLTQLTDEILITIKNNEVLLGKLRDLVGQASLNCSLNGQGIINTTGCSYSAQLDTSITGTTVGAVYIAGTSYPAPNGLLATDASAISSWLNSLLLGTFSVSYSSGTSKTTITSTNTNILSFITIYKGGVAENRYVVAFNSDCNTICSILQQIINYLKNLNLYQVLSNESISICRFNNDGTVDVHVFDPGTPASVIVQYLAGSICNVINYMKDRAVTCAAIKATFAAYTNTTGNPTAGDILLGFRNGKCQQYPLKSVAIGIFNLLCSDSDVKSAYCSCAKCSTVGDCEPVTNLSGSAGDTTANFTWDPVVSAIGYKWSLDGINWTNVLSTAALVTGLTPGTSYVFRVYPVYNNGDGDICVATINFVTTDESGGCAAPENLVINNVTATSFTANWNAVPGASGYQYQLNGGLWNTIGIVTSFTVSGLIASTSYTFTLRAIIVGNPCEDTTSDVVLTLPTCTDEGSAFCSTVKDYADNPSYGKQHIIINDTEDNVVNSSNCCVTIQEVHFNSDVDTLITTGDVLGYISPECLPTCPEGMTRALAVTQPAGNLFNLLDNGNLVWAGPSFTLIARLGNPAINYPASGANAIVIKAGTSCCVADEPGSGS